MRMPEKYRELNSLLLKASNENRVAWKELRNGCFAVTFSTFAFELWEGQDAISDAPFIAVGIRNNVGKIIDNIRMDANDPDHGSLKELLAVARRRARKVDEALGRMVKELKGGGKVGQLDSVF